MALTEVGLAKELDKQGYELLTYENKDQGKLEVQANKLHGVFLKENDEVFIPVPVTLDLELDEHQGIKELKYKDSDIDVLKHASSFVRTLVENGQVNGLDGQAAKHASHQIETNAKGQRIIKRKGFSIL
jgi:hypothetical protein